MSPPLLGSSIQIAGARRAERSGYQAYPTIQLTVKVHRKELLVEVSDIYFRQVDGMLRLFERGSQTQWVPQRPNPAAEMIDGCTNLSGL